MPRTTGFVIAAVLTLTLGASAGAGEELRLTLDPERTTIGFELGATLPRSTAPRGCARVRSSSAVTVARRAVE